MLTRLLTITLLCITHVCAGLDKGPEILRICADNDAKSATLFWQLPTDLCNSFKKYQISTSENNGPWQIDTIIFQITTTTCSIILPNLTSDWRFKLSTYSACNGLDSFVSIQSIEKNLPPYLALDSVSFDYATQKISAGWKKNPALDTKGYWLYNLTSTDYDKIIETNKTSVILSSFSKSNPSRISLATYDSCNLFGPISQTHKAVYLNAIIDSCKRTIKFDWTKYEGEGWTNVKQYLVVNKNNLGFTIFNSLTPTQTNFELTGITLGDNLCYYVRTEEIASKKTSSSNTICFKTRKLNEPTINHLRNVTVENDISIKLNFIADIKADTDSFLIEKKEGGATDFVNFARIIRNPSQSIYLIEDKNADFNSNHFTYRIKTVDKCGNISSISNLGQSIFLRKPILSNGSYEFSWNTYDGWEKGVDYQLIEISDDRFTWNILDNKSPNQSSINYAPEQIELDSLCFRIKNFEITNSLNTTATSMSNVKCIYTISDFYLPGTINPYSNNNVLKVYGNGIDRSRGKIEVFNRWGEKIFETKNIDQGWNGMINDEFVMMGSYIYKAYFYDQQNNYYLKTGTVFIIR